MRSNYSQSGTSPVNKSAVHVAPKIGTGYEIWICVSDRKVIVWLTDDPGGVTTSLSTVFSTIAAQSEQLPILLKL